MSESKTTAPKILGSIRPSNGRADIHVEDVYPTDLADLWRAVSEPDRLKRWLVTVEGDTAIGGSFTAVFTSGWEGTGRVDICDAPHHLVVTTFDENEETVIEATLTEEGEGTRLVIEERGLSVEEAPSHGAGWQAHIEDLAAYLSGRELSNWRDRLLELAPTYRAMKL